MPDPQDVGVVRSQVIAADDTAVKPLLSVALDGSSERSASGTLTIAVLTERSSSGSLRNLGRLLIAAWGARPGDLAVAPPKAGMLAQTHQMVAQRRRILFRR